jgi:ABC-2 type transport system permease protein
MKKYLEVAKITFKSQLVYRFEVITGMLFSLIGIILAYLLWSVLFQAKTEIAGFTFPMMIGYYILIQFFRRLDRSDELVWQLSAEIREGQFTKYLVRPIQPLWFFIANSFAKTAFVFLLNVVTTVGYLLLFNNLLLLRVSLITYLNAAIISFLGLYFMALVNYFIAILSFKFLDIGAFNIFKLTILEFITGGLLPLALLPEWFQNGLRLLPFFYPYYFPTMLILNRESTRFVTALLVLVFWNLLMLGLILGTYQLLLRKYEGVGA